MSQYTSAAAPAVRAACARFGPLVTANCFLWLAAALFANQAIQLLGFEFAFLR